MNKITPIDPGTKLLRISEACQRYRMCRTSILKLGEDAHAIVRVGRSIWLNMTRMDSYFDEITI